MTRDSIPQADESDPKDMGIRELLIEVRTDMKWVKAKLGAVCNDVKGHEERIQELEKVDAKSEGATTEKKDSTAMAIAIAAIIISAVTSVMNLIGG